MPSDIIKEEAYTYVGTEMRKYMRRLKADRREMLRYEPDKDNRRVSAERRHGSAAWDQLSTRD
jgi:hypothetical protein